MASVDVSNYEHSPVHKAIILKDNDGLDKIISELPRFSDPSEVKTESDSLAEDAKADAIAAMLDRRDVPNRETPLHLAVKFSDHIAFEKLLLAGADYGLQNDKGWTAMDEAISNGENHISTIMSRHYDQLAWAKWHRRLPWLIATMRRMRDFYMEIKFHFESSAIPFISRMAPSDTYKIWKRGANLRVDLTLTGFEGFRVQRSSMSVRFLGDGAEDGKVPPGTLCVVSHKDKVVMHGLVGSADPVSESDIQRERYTTTSVTNGRMSFNQAALLPRMTWRRREKTEMVGEWKAKVYDMHNVVVTSKSKKVLRARTTDYESDSEIIDVLTEEERQQLDKALKIDSNVDNIIDQSETKREKKGWLSDEDQERDVVIQVTESFSLTPSLWLSSDFPLRTEEFLPLLDIFANRVTAVRQLREYLVTKVPQGTFPVKVSIPVIPTVRVIVTFTKFEELKPIDEDLATPSSSPATAVTQSSSSSWFRQTKSPSTERAGNIKDPFAFPSGYTWLTSKDKKQRKVEVDLRTRKRS